MIHELNALGESCMRALWHASLQGGIVLTVVWCICRFVPRISPALKVWLWRIAWLKLLLTLFWTGSIDLPLLAPPAPTVIERVSAVGVGDTVQAVAPAESIRERIKPSATLFVIWLVGVLGGFIHLGCQWRQSVRLRRHCSPFASATIVELCSRLRIKRVPSVCTSSAMSAPVLVGILRPVVIIPPDVPADKLRMMLAHELAHLKRHDLLWGWLPAICQTLVFFHPLLWLTRREWLLVQEMACDELALCRSATSPAAYGKMLVDLVAAAVPRPGFGALGICETTQNLKRRIQAMKIIGIRKSRWLMSALVVVSIVCVLPWRLVAQDRPEDAARRIEQLEKENASLRQELQKLRKRPGGDKIVHQLRVDLLNERLAHESALASLNRASNALVRYELLFKDKLVSSDVLEQARVDVNKFQTEIALRNQIIGEIEAALIGPTEGTVIARTAMEDDRAARARQLYLEELVLAQKYVDSVGKRFESGRATQEDLFRAQKQLFALKREATSQDTNRAELKELVQEEIAVVERLLKEAKKRAEIGVAPQGEELNLQRELLRLKRELLSVDQP